MRLNSSFLAALVGLTALAGCGTKTALTLPPQAQPAPSAVSPTPTSFDHSNKAAEPRQ
ncbi:MAG: lipoprotein [Sulfuritalea sp.]|nr:lipoprotein [Sulfuritalea sp.]